MDSLDACFTPSFQGKIATDQDGYIYLRGEWVDEEEECSGPIEIISNPVLEEYEKNILSMITEVAWLARNLYASGYEFPVKGHPVDISFCFEPGSWLREQDWDGYKLNEDILENWEMIDQMASLLSV